MVMGRKISSSGWRGIRPVLGLVAVALGTGCVDEAVTTAPLSPAARTALAGDSTAGVLLAPLGGPQVLAGVLGDTVVLDFEGIGNLVLVGDYYKSRGASFDSTVARTVFNSAVWPPRSGGAVATGNANSGTRSAVIVRFVRTVSRVGLYVTSTDKNTSLSCYNTAGTLLGTAALPGANLKLAGYLYPPNYPLFVNAAGIARCVLRGPRNGYFVDDLTFLPEAQPKLKVGLTGDSVGPVLAARFDARTQQALAGDGTADPRLDRVNVRIGPDSTGATLPGAQVWVISRPAAGSGGHDHGGATRPRGTFFLPSDAGRIPEPAAGSRDSIRVTLSSSGTADLIYRTSGVSGQEWLVVRLDATGSVAQDSARVMVKLPGLVELTAAPGISLAAGSPGHPWNHWGNPAALVALRELGDSVSARAAYYAAAPALRRPRATMPGAITVTDMSLAWGGLLDPGGGFTAPYLGHRTGTEADLGVPPTAEGALLAEFINQLWVERWGRRLEDERLAASHLHLYTR